MRYAENEYIVIGVSLGRDIIIRILVSVHTGRNTAGDICNVRTEERSMPLRSGELHRRPALNPAADDVTDVTSRQTESSPAVLGLVDRTGSKAPTSTTEFLYDRKGTCLNATPRSAGQPYLWAVLDVATSKNRYQVSQTIRTPIIRFAPSIPLRWRRCATRLLSDPSSGRRALAPHRCETTV